MKLMPQTRREWKELADNPFIQILAPYLGFAIGWQLTEWMK